jgi:hypothetical protein
MDNEVIIKAPGWVAKDDVLSLLRQDLQMKLAYYQSQCRTFEQKYQKSFAEYDAALRAERQEDFQQWEDYMDWEAADSARQEIEQRLQELAAWKT